MSILGSQMLMNIRLEARPQDKDTGSMDMMPESINSSLDFRRAVTSGHVTDEGEWSYIKGEYTLICSTCSLHSIDYVHRNVVISLYIYLEWLSNSSQTMRISLYGHAIKGVQFSSISPSGVCCISASCAVLSLLADLDRGRKVRPVIDIDVFDGH